MNIFYICNYRKIIIMHLLERGYDLNKYSLDSLISDELGRSNSITNAIHLCLTDKTYFRIGDKDATKQGNAYYLNVSLNDIYDHLRIPNATYKKTLLKIIRGEFPNCILSPIIKEGITTPTNYRFIEVIDEISRDASMSVFFYDALEDIELFLIHNKISHPDLQMADLINLTIRLFIPKDYLIYLSSFLKSTDIIYKQPLLLNDHLIYEQFGILDDDDRNILKEKMYLDGLLYFKHNNDMYLSSNTVYSTVISLSITQWSKIIDVIFEKDKYCAHPVISSIPYFLSSRRLTRELLSINEENNKKIMEATNV